MEESRSSSSENLPDENKDILSLINPLSYFKKTDSKKLILPLVQFFLILGLGIGIYFLAVNRIETEPTPLVVAPITRSTPTPLPKKTRIPSSAISVTLTPPVSQGDLASTPSGVQPQAADTIISTNRTSPDGSYTVRETYIGDRQIITIENSYGVRIIDDLIAQNQNEIGYDIKFKCPCATYFKGWVSSSRFAIKVVSAGDEEKKEGDEYEYLVDAASGKVDISTFRQVK